MPVRSLSRTARTVAAAGALTLALSAPSLARPDDCACGGARAPESSTNHLFTAGTDVAARDQQNPTAEPRPVPQPPTWPLHPVALTQPKPAAEAGPAFQWDDAGIGAAGALGVVCVALGGVVLVRRRHVPTARAAA